MQPLGMPDAVRAAALAAFGAGPSGNVVADLVFDSLVDAQPDPVGPGQRRLRFACALGEVQLDVAEAGDTVSVGGLISPGRPADVEVRSTGRAFTVRADEGGALQFDAPAGLLSLLIAPADAGDRQIQTAWVRL